MKKIQREKNNFQEKKRKHNQQEELQDKKASL
jgi:hypothetical protein